MKRISFAVMDLGYSEATLRCQYPGLNEVSLVGHKNEGLAERHVHLDDGRQERGGRGKR